MVVPCRICPACRASAGASTAHSRATVQAPAGTVGRAAAATTTPTAGGSSHAGDEPRVITLLILLLQIGLLVAGATHRANAQHARSTHVRYMHTSCARNCACVPRPAPAREEETVVGSLFLSV